MDTFVNHLPRDLDASTPARQPLACPMPASHWQSQ